tara:strand:- start:43 stop:630 length:588 start_codon:yes stop_codon:yes gene_type:complete
MASRIGKYKVSKRESTISLVDGGTASSKVKLNGNTGLVAGSGFSDAALFKSWTQDLGGISKTTVLIDLTGIRSTAANDIIGNDGAASANIGQYTTAVMGTLFAVEMSCIEAPGGGDPDINLAFADEATLAEDSALSAGTNNGTVLNNGDLAAEKEYWAITGFPAANQYLYLVAGATTDGDYNAGVIKIEFYGTNV